MPSPITMADNCEANVSKRWRCRKPSSREFPARTSTGRGRRATSWPKPGWAPSLLHRLQLPQAAVRRRAGAPGGGARRRQEGAHQRSPLGARSGFRSAVPQRLGVAPRCQGAGARPRPGAPAHGRGWARRWIRDAENCHPSALGKASAALDGMGASSGANGRRMTQSWFEMLTPWRHWRCSSTHATKYNHCRNS